VLTRLHRSYAYLLNGGMSIAHTSGHIRQNGRLHDCRLSKYGLTTSVYRL
jgi:hypothetical protein